MAHLHDVAVTDRQLGGVPRERPGAHATFQRRRFNSSCSEHPRRDCCGLSHTTYRDDASGWNVEFREWSQIAGFQRTVGVDVGTPWDHPIKVRRRSNIHDVDALSGSHQRLEFSYGDAVLCHRQGRRPQMRT